MRTPSDTLTRLRTVVQPSQGAGGADEFDYDALIRYYDVVSADGTRLRAWTNQPPNFRGRDRRPVVLLCNGLGTNAFAWPALLDPDCAVRVISWNHRGVGGSDRPADRNHCGIDAFVEDAIAVMDDAKVKACPVLGWSMGVNTAFELAVLHPDRVTGIFAVAGVPGGTFASMLEPFGLPRFARAGLTVGAAVVMKHTGMPLSHVTTRLAVGPAAGYLLSHSGFMLPTADLRATRRCVKDLLSTPVEWYMHLGYETSKHKRVSLKTINVPVAFLAGRWDLLAGPDDMRSAAKKIPGASFGEIWGSHFITLERPAEVHRRMLRWLDRIPS